MRFYVGAKYLEWFGGEKYYFIYNRITYLMGVKSVITYAIFYNCPKIKVDPYDSLLLEKMLTFHNVIILIKPVFNKDKNNHC